jgi:hypothetical protein
VGSTLPGETLVLGQFPRTLKNYDIKPHDAKAGCEFIYTATYEQSNADPNPLSRKDLISFEGSRETEEYFMDEGDGTAEDPKPVVNSAYDVFEKNPERTTGAFRLIVTGNRTLASVDLAQIAQYLRPSAVNSSSIVVRGKTIGAGEAKLVAVTMSDPQFENGTEYVQLKWEMECASDWDDHLEDRGFNELDLFGTGQIEIWRGKPPQAVKKPWPLDGSGNALETAGDAPEVLVFHPYPKKDFSVFGWTTSA